MGQNSVNWIDPWGLSPAGWLIKLTETGLKKVATLGSDKAARRARQQGKNVLFKNSQAAKAGEIGTYGSEGLLKHKGHDLPSGNKGNPHFQTKGKMGHSFWGAVIGFVGLLNPFDAIGGELDGSEDADINGNGIPDWQEQYMDDPCP